MMQSMWKTAAAIGVAAIMCVGAAWANNPPVVSGVVASQRTDGSKIVDIYYNLSDGDGDACTVTVQASSDGGATWTVPITAVTGAVGGGIAPGSGKHVTWQSATDLPGAFGSQYKVRVCADDGHMSVPPGMVPIPAGTFQMGNCMDPDEGQSNELPVHSVYVSAFYIDAYEVCKTKWDAVRSWAVSNGYNLINAPAKGADHPVYDVRYYDAVKFCNARSEQEGRTPCYYTDAGLSTVYRSGQLTPYVNWSANGYRLPTEAEWEKAARGGASGQRFPWGNTINHDHANYRACGTCYAYDDSPYSSYTYHPDYDDGGTPYTCPVGTHSPNGYGCYNMAGNVWEWCNDWYDAGYYGDSPPGGWPADPTGPNSGDRRVMRGGSWVNYAPDCRVAYRAHRAPDYPDDRGGLRCVAGTPSGLRDSDCTDSVAFTLDNSDVQAADVIGRVIEDASGDPPVAGATLTLQPIGRVATSTGDGTFALLDVPVATGYGLEVSAEGFEPFELNPVDVAAGMNDLGDIALTPLSGNFVIQAISPALHNGASIVETGGVAYRYFRVVNVNSGDPQGNVRVNVRFEGGDPNELIDQSGYPTVAGWAGSTPGLSDAETGFVRLCIPADLVGGPGSSETFETVLADETVGPAFTVEVVERAYEHGWTQSAGGGVNVGVNIFGVDGRLGGGRAYTGMIYRPSHVVNDAEEVANGALQRLTFGVGVGPPVGGALTIDDAHVGANAGTGAGVYAEFDRQFGYGFDTVAPDGATEAAMRLYCLYASATGVTAGPPIDTVVNSMRSLIEPWFLDDHWRWSEGGFEIGRYGEASAVVGVTGTSGFNQGAYAELEANAGVRTRCRWDVLAERWVNQFGVVSEASGDVGVGFGFESYNGTGRPAAVAGIMNRLSLNESASGWVGAEQLLEIESADGASRPDLVRLITRAGGTLSWWDAVDELVGGTDPNESDVLVTITVEQPISSNTEWLRAASLPGLTDLLVGTGAPAINNAFGSNVATGLFGNHAYAADMRYRYTAELADPWQTEVGAEGTLVGSLGVHFTADAARTRTFELEHGIIRGSHVFPLQSTPGADGIPSNTQSIVDIQADWVFTALPWLEGILNTFEWLFPGRSDAVIQATTSAGAAELLVPSGTFPAGTSMVIDSWTDDSVLIDGWRYGVGGMYRFDADAEPNNVMTLMITYLDDSVIGVPEADLRMYRRNTGEQTWELIGGVVDPDANAVTADIDHDGLYTLAPALPTGDIDFTYSATVLPADGVSTATVESGDLSLNLGGIVADGELYTVKVQGMDVLTADADPNLPDVQVASVGGTILFEIVAPETGGVGTFIVESVFGTANGTGMIAFEDDLAPPMVADVQLVAGQSRVWVSWDDSDMPTDIAYYRVQYSKDHVPPPFDGTARVEGADSPVRVAGTPVLLRGLDAGAEYHVAVSAVDKSGNESPLSTVVSVVTAEAPPTPPVGVTYALADGQRYEVSWALSEDDGFNDRDVDHYEVFRWVVPGEIAVKVADVPAGTAFYIDDASGLPPHEFVMYEVAAVDTAGLSSARVGLLFDPDVDDNGAVDFDDFVVFGDCMNGAAVEPPTVPDCLDAFDANGDGDVDLADYATFSLMVQ